MEQWEQDFFFFRAATQDKEVSDESDVAYENGSEDEDDILYSCPWNSDSHKPCALLFT